MGTQKEVQDQDSNKHKPEHENEADKDWKVDKSGEGHEESSSTGKGKQENGHSSEASETTEKWNAAQHGVSQDTGNQAKQVETGSSHKAVHDDAKKVKSDASV